jgi:hypothetical protein
MVNLWWNAGERWSENDPKLRAKIFHLFCIYFLTFPSWVRRGTYEQSSLTDNVGYFRMGDGPEVLLVKESEP